MTDIAKLGIAIDATSATTAAASLDKFADSSTKAETASEKMEKAIRSNMTEAERFIASLERQTTLHGKSATDALRYDASLIKMTTDQRAQTEALLKTAEAQEKSTGALSRWTDVAKGAAAAIGLYKLAEYAKDAALMAARYETLGVTMGVVGNNAGYTSAQMEGYAQALQKSGIAMLESRELVTRLAQAHMDLGNSTNLARIAQDAAVIGGINSTEAFERLVAGIQKGDTEILRGIGINVNFEASYAKLAVQLKKNAADLTETEKTQARVNSVMEVGADIAGAYEKSMGTAGKQLTSMKRYSDDLKTTIGGVFNEALTIGVMGVTEGFKGMNDEAKKLAQEGQLKEWGNDALQVLAGVADAFYAGYVGAKLVVEHLITSGAALFEAAKGNFTFAKDLISDQIDKDKEAIAGIGKFTRALEERNAAIAEKNKELSDAQEKYYAAVADAQKKYAGESLETQRAVMIKLAEEYDDELKRINNIASSRKKEASAADAKEQEAILKRYQDEIDKQTMSSIEYQLKQINERYDKEFKAIKDAKNESTLRYQLEKEQQAEIAAAWKSYYDKRDAEESGLTSTVASEAQKRISVEATAANAIAAVWDQANAAKAARTGGVIMNQGTPGEFVSSWDANNNYVGDIGASSGLAFATGGSFVVGGSGGTDTTKVDFMATPGERVTIETPEQQRKSNASGAPVFHITMNGVNDPAEMAKRLQQFVRTNPLALSAAGLTQRAG